MPEGSALLIAAWRSPDGTSLGTMIPTVLRTDKPPFCTPNTTPLGVVPIQLPIQQVTAPTGPGPRARANPYPSTPAAG